MPLPITSAEFKDMESIKSVLTEDERSQFNPVPSGLKRGEASFHHPMMVHGSYANRCGLCTSSPVPYCRGGYGNEAALTFALILML